MSGAEQAPAGPGAVLWLMLQVRSVLFCPQRPSGLPKSHPEATQARRNDDHLTYLSHFPDEETEAELGLLQDPATAAGRHMLLLPALPPGPPGVPCAGREAPGLAPASASPSTPLPAGAVCPFPGAQPWWLLIVSDTASLQLVPRAEQAAEPLWPRGRWEPWASSFQLLEGLGQRQPLGLWGVGSPALGRNRVEHRGLGVPPARPGEAGASAA